MGAEHDHGLKQAPMQLCLVGHHGSRLQRHASKCLPLLCEQNAQDRRLESEPSREPASIFHELDLATKCGAAKPKHFCGFGDATAAPIGMRPPDSFSR